MEKTFINLVIGNLFFVSISALIGVWSLLADPSGEALQLPLALLQDTAFPDFFTPV